MDTIRQNTLRRRFEGLFGRKNKSVILSPLEGRVVPLKEVPDEVFSEEVMGKGVAIIPERGTLFSPVTGRVDSVTDAKHAIVLISEKGVEVLIHIGIDTVALKGVPFRPLVKTGDPVKPGDLLINFDIGAIKAAGFPIISPVLIVNAGEYGGLVFASGAVKPGDTLITVK
jgi:PTS system beta-glucosides-specific IIC component